MREELLQFIWRYRYFNHQLLVTELGQALEILFPGKWNRDQGPDFREARIRLDGQVVEGPIELHLLTSDWIRHAHDKDVHYRDTILHVVWENDWPPGGGLPGGVPVLALHQRVPKLLLDRYERWNQQTLFIPCESMLSASTMPAAILCGWQRQLMLERLRQRADRIRESLSNNCQDWAETTWIWMARSMGQRVNASAFEAIARSLPIRLLARYRGQRMEALLLGQAGLLEEPSDLHQEYCFLKAKHRLVRPSIPLSFLRMRPAHFPAKRLMQLAGLISPDWFAFVRETVLLKDLIRRLEGHRGIGAEMRQGLVINAFIPLLFAYGWLREEPASREKALGWLLQLGSEKNAVLARWRLLGMTPQTAGDSQALLQLKREYCEPRRCLDCAIGRALIRDWSGLALQSAEN
jgi:hypothetical protein